MIIRKLTAVLSLLVLSACSSPATPLAKPTPWRPAGVVKVLAVVDGDTLKTSAGVVRLLGINTPERGECDYQEATDSLRVTVEDGDLVTLAVAPGQDKDRYGRLLRYVVVYKSALGSGQDPTDAGLEQIESQYAHAYYDSVSPAGYKAHPRQAEYRAADVAGPLLGCEPTPTPTPEPTYSGGPFKSCADAHEHGVRRLHKGEPGWNGRLDGDGDGTACES